MPVPKMFIVLLLLLLYLQFNCSFFKKMRTFSFFNKQNCRNFEFVIFNYALSSLSEFKGIL